MISSGDLASAFSNRKPSGVPSCLEGPQTKRMGFFTADSDAQEAHRASRALITFPCERGGRWVVEVEVSFGVPPGPLPPEPCPSDLPSAARSFPAGPSLPHTRPWPPSFWLYLWGAWVETGMDPARPPISVCRHAQAQKGQIFPLGI